MATQYIEQGDALNVLGRIPDEFFDCVITSPPYWGLRDYGVDGQLGLEPTYQEYLDRLIQIMAECKRVLKDSGTMWVNIGDSYSTMSGNMGKGLKYGGMPKFSDNAFNSMPEKMKVDMPAKSLIGIPERFAIRMTDELGMIRRNTIIWWKRNCMPSSVKDRFTVDFEPIYFFTKNKKYWFEQQKEPTVTFDYSKRDRNNTKLNNVPGRTRMGGLVTNQYKERNVRCVWDITTKPFKGAHFAVFPETLVEPMLSAGCPSAGWVLDPFSGSGTVGVVAKKQDKNFIGIELNPEYIKMAESRM